MFSSARRPAGLARCRLAGANVLRHAVELYDGYSEVHVITALRERKLSSMGRSTEALEIARCP